MPNEVSMDPLLKILGTFNQSDFHVELEKVIPEVERMLLNNGRALLIDITEMQADLDDVPPMDKGLFDRYAQILATGSAALKKVLQTPDFPIAKALLSRPSLIYSENAVPLMFTESAIAQVKGIAALLVFSLFWAGRQKEPPRWMHESLLAALEDAVSEFAWFVATLGVTTDVPLKRPLGNANLLCEVPQ